MQIPDEQLDLRFDTYKVTERISAKSRSIRVEVISPTEVTLVIPRFVARQVARDFLRSRDGWIRQKLAELQQRADRDAEGGPSPHLRWDGTDLLPLHGGAVPLKIVQAQVRPVVRVEPERVTLFCPGSWLAETAKLEHLLRETLRREAATEARVLLNREATRLGVNFQGPRIADQRTLWGSCTPDGLISLSWRLLLTPPEAFRYVVIHELCHRVHLDHSDAFWSLVARQMPDHARHRQWLREHGQRLHWYLKS
ncbi:MULTISPECIES: M48 family metallopeptidase [Hydrocarboniphaga]|uniref:YgjP-like metallopeptidase domain-containing protein n=1 Tax=Hydrocarboniphaga effusa AP103 TaxID=1172194 RepID=I7ZHZ0_9GAMM|nr:MULTISPECIES: SprT family zinc-dependent metalloprotease [Hydrocarboniphaga]EIT71372.1 hypothetical protein WQQ_15090 [Hydrocarboniphaga effusa AP103]MDZ4077639.1 SprT family zinc-dependent metalloprotease [Hydrocarboniphaga sp.]